MKNNTIEELKKLKIVIEKKKNGIKDIKKLINQDIDLNSFELYAEEYESEKINSMNKTLNVMRSLTDPRPFSRDISSHRKFSGFFIVLTKKILLKIMKLYTNLLLDRQKKHNEHNLDFQSYSIENQKLLDNRLGKIEGKLVEIENSFDNLEEKLELYIKKTNNKEK